jgi:S-DNA-T family DNA segregation ATPase FtsK/SpoIIIE
VNPEHVSEDEDDRPYVMPDINAFLASPPKAEARNREQTEEEIRQTSQVLKDKLAEFGIEAQVMNVNIGPIITQYELKPAPGVKVSRFPNLADDLALAIKAKSIRVQAPIPGKGLIGIEVPNPRRDTIFLKDILLSDDMRKSECMMVFALGKDISGNPLVTDLTKMPHLLIAGATGAGKSVCINAAITGLLLTRTPDQVRLVLIDPKRIELSGYEGIPHLIQNVVTDPEDALMVLNWAVSEMERRYLLLQKYNVRDIAGYNQRISIEPEPDGDEHLPYIVIVVDEFADLIMTAGREIELPLARLAQMARAIGIHLILATQRPSIKVITGIIKANFPARIAFQVSSKMDSRVILDANGAERLLGRGDMLFLPPGKGTPERIHGAYVSDREIENIVEYLRKQPKPKIRIEMLRSKVEDLADFEYDDDLFPEAARAVVSAGTASVSMLQRHFKIGYARAGRLVDLLEKSGVIGPHSGSKSRDVMMTNEDLENHGY